MAGYNKNTTYQDGDVIRVADTLNEFSLLDAAFDASSGHTHSGAAGEGAAIPAASIVNVASAGITETDTQGATDNLGARMNTLEASVPLLDAEVVKITGDQSIDGVKTFTSAILSDLTGDVTGNSAGVHTGNVTGDLTGNSAGVHTGAVTGDLTGNSAGVHTGNVTGDLTGDSAGTHTGAVTGNLTGNSAGVHTGNVTGDVTGNLAGNADTSTDCSRSVVAGAGVTGGGALNADVTINVVGGDGITANADDIEVDSTVVRTSGTQTISGTKNFSGMNFTTAPKSDGVSMPIPIAAGRIAISAGGAVTITGQGISSCTDQSSDAFSRTFRIGLSVSGSAAGNLFTVGHSKNILSAHNILNDTGVSTTVVDLQIQNSDATTAVPFNSTEMTIVVWDTGR